MAKEKKKHVKYNFKPSKPVPKIQKLPVKQQIVHERRHHRHVRTQSSEDLSREEKCAAAVIIILFFAALAYLFTQ